MGFLGSAARGYMLHRLARGRGRRTGYNGYGSRYARRPRRSSGFGLFGPVPTYTRRTRRGSRVSVGGCCLPIPLMLTVGGAYSLRRTLRRR